MRFQPFVLCPSENEYHVSVSRIRILSFDILRRLQFHCTSHFLWGELLMQGQPECVQAHACTVYQMMCQPTCWPCVASYCKARVISTMLRYMSFL